MLLAIRCRGIQQWRKRFRSTVRTFRWHAEQWPELCQLLRHGCCDGLRHLLPQLCNLCVGLVDLWTQQQSAVKNGTQRCGCMACELWAKHQCAQRCCDSVECPQRVPGP